jgi:hypothetical protein
VDANKIQVKISRIHPGRCIGFIEEEAKTADTTPMKATQYKRNVTRTTTQPTTTERQELALHGLLLRKARRQHTRPLDRVTTEGNSKEPTPTPNWHRSTHRSPLSA